MPHHDQLMFVRGGDIEYPDKNVHAQSGRVVCPLWRAQEIYLCDLSGGVPRKLAEGHAPLASPDGSTLLFLHAGGVYATMPNPRRTRVQG